MSEALNLSDFPLHAHDTLRYADTDRQGHVNNAVFSTFFETGRVQFLYDPERPLIEPGFAFVIASLYIDFLSEVTWPGTVSIGTRVAGIGRSSLKLEQGLFQDTTCAATAKSVIVLVNEATRRSHPFDTDTIERLSALTAP
ncbi:acyl-CoA thioesterase [Amorphus sp. 3PC139-8]|uniref:acyl-CoA thioesterase n=1 Tax=Amorphus sp. 3PC139-8 TaxID=2735676 RepID=UPI00345D480C